MRPDQLDAERACVLVIDMQEKLMPLIRHSAEVTAAVEKLLTAAPIFELPVIVTEQNPAGIGRTVGAVANAAAACGAHVLEKASFSAWAQPSVRKIILATDRPQVVLAGIESHVCVQQTVLDLVSRDYDVYVCADAVGSRGAVDHEQALARMRQAGAWVTTVESVLFELCGRCDVPPGKPSGRFKPMLEVIKRFPPT